MSDAHTVAETPAFIRDCKAAGLDTATVKRIIDGIALNPKQGDVVQGSGGVRKVRFAAVGRGKSGGYRVMTAYFGSHAPVYLLALLQKNERANFTPAEVAAFKALTVAIDKAWKDRPS